MTRAFPEIKKRLGFGLMRFPRTEDDTLDFDKISEMVDEFILGGFNYFDTAHGYIKGLSEKAVKRCLSSRHDRESYVLTNKLTGTFFKSREEVRPLFDKQLEECGVD